IVRAGTQYCGAIEAEEEVGSRETGARTPESRYAGVAQASVSYSESPVSLLPSPDCVRFIKEGPGAHSVRALPPEGLPRPARACGTSGGSPTEGEYSDGARKHKQG